MTTDRERSRFNHCVWRLMMTASVTLTVLGTSAAWCDTVNFDGDTAGSPPKGWSC